MSMQWRRLWRDSLNCPKIGRLTDRQHRVWHNCLILADDDGVLPSIADAAWHLRLSIEDTEASIIDLTEAGLIDPAVASNGRRTYRMHDWERWQAPPSDGSAERTRRYRDRLRGSSSNEPTSHVTARDVTVTARDVTVTALDPDPELDSDLDPPEQVAARDPDIEAPGPVARDVGGERIAPLLGVGLGGEPSIEARRRVCQRLGIADAEPLVALYRDWRGSRTARDPDAKFIASAAKIYDRARPEVRAACRPAVTAMEIAAPPPPVSCSPQLAASLAKLTASRSARGLGHAH